MAIQFLEEKKKKVATQMCDAAYYINHECISLVLFRGCSSISFCNWVHRNRQGTGKWIRKPTMTHGVQSEIHYEDILWRTETLTSKSLTII